MSRLIAPSKESVQEWWNSHVCDTEDYSEDWGRKLTTHSKYSKEYFDAIEQLRYHEQPDIFAFAQFTRHYGKRILEVGVGAGTDFLQWVRAGTRAFGVDFTPSAIETVSRRLAAYGTKCEGLQVADAENLPFPDNSFDLVYSWGVLHHSPDTARAIREVIRVTRPGGTVKIMLYNRRSPTVIGWWILHALFKGKPFQSLSRVLYYNVESPGTRAFTKAEVREMLRGEPVDHLWFNATGFRGMDPPRAPTLVSYFKYLTRCLLTLAMGFADFFMKIEFRKSGSPSEPRQS